MSYATLRIGTFTRPVVLEVARRDGSLEAASINIVESAVASSPAQFESLEAGDYDLVFTSPDNVIAYRFVSTNPLGRLMDVQIVGAVDRGLGLSLCLSPSTQSVDQIRDHVVGVDVPTSGFAFVAYELLRRAGLGRDDYSLKSLGSTPRRGEALVANECAATVLNAGNELRAAGAGCRVHSTVNDIGPYLGTVIAATASADEEKNEVRRRFVRVVHETVGRIIAGEREAEAIDAARVVLELSESEAFHHYQCLLDPRNGLIANGLVDVESVSTLLELRRRYLANSELDGIEGLLETFISSELLA